MKVRTRYIAALTALVLALTCAFLLAACNSSDSINYSADNNFEVNFDSSDARDVYSPEGKTSRYGLIFYVGTALEPQYYEYLGRALASEGYTVVIPKVRGNFAYLNYKDNEAAFGLFPDIQFFVGGHSQGGAAAIRRTQENADKVLGAVLFAPLRMGEYDLHGVDVPTLLLNASNDRVLSDGMKEDVLSCLDEDKLTAKTITPGAHMCFSTFDKDEYLEDMMGDGDGITAEQKEMQRTLTISYTLEFMRQVISGRN